MRILISIILCLLLQSCATAVHERHYDAGKRSFADGDYKKSLHELLPLAVDGDPKAQYAVGYMYYYGYGVSMDMDAGRVWMEKSASKGYPPAVEALRMLK